MLHAKNVVYPRVWDKFSRELKIPAFGALAITFLGTVFAVHLGDHIVAWTLALFFVGFAGGVSALYTWRLGSDRAPRVRVKSGRSAGLFVPELKVRKTFLLLSLAVGAPVFVLISVHGDSFLGEGSSSGSRSLYALAWISVQLAPLVSVFLIVASVTYIAGRLAVKGEKIGVEMDIAGIYHWWWAGCSFFPWDEVSGVHLMPPAAGPIVKLMVARYDYGANPAETSLGRKIWVRRRSRKLNLGGLRTHPGLVYQAMFFYLRNPELRDELEDERSVERMQRRDYGKIPLEIDTHGRALSPEEAAAK